MWAEWYSATARFCKQPLSLSGIALIFHRLYHESKLCISRVGRIMSVEGARKAPAFLHQATRRKVHVARIRLFATSQQMLGTRRLIKC